MLNLAASHGAAETDDDHDPRGIDIDCYVVGSSHFFEHLTMTTKKIRLILNQSSFLPLNRAK